MQQNWRSTILELSKCCELLELPEPTRTAGLVDSFVFVLTLSCVSSSCVVSFLVSDAVDGLLFIVAFRRKHAETLPLNVMIVNVELLLLLLSLLLSSSCLLLFG